MTQEELRLLEEKLRSIPLEELNKITINRMTRTDNMSSYNIIRDTKYIQDISIIPESVLNNNKIPTERIRDTYGVAPHLISRYRKDNGIILDKSWRDLIPDEELNDLSLSARFIADKYNLEVGLIYKYRRQKGIKKDSVLLSLSHIPLEELNDASFLSTFLAKKYNVKVSRIKQYRAKNGIRKNNS